MMTSDEINAAIKRLRNLVSNNYKMDAFEVMKTAFGAGTPWDYCDALIDLLRHADSDTYMELPRDADGKVIHVGDWMVLTVCTTNESAKVEEKMVIVEAVDERGYYYRNRGTKDTRLWRACGSVSHHYHKPIVEEVLTEFVARWHDTHHDDIPELFAEYAAKLREVLADE